MGGWTRSGGGPLDTGADRNDVTNVSSYILAGWIVCVTFRYRIIIVVALFGILLLFHRPIGFMLLLGLGRSPACEWTEAVRGFYGKHREQKRLQRTFEQSVSLVRTDPAGYQLWQTPRSQIWLPPRSEKMLPWLLTHMERRIYEIENCGVQRGDVVLDCGAHVGLFAEYALETGAEVVVAIDRHPVGCSHALWHLDHDAW